MGVDAGDFDNDGDEDLFVTELTGQGSDLYVNDGTGRLRGSERARRGIGAPSLPYTGFGAAWLDVDNDGWLDMLTVNGAVHGDRGAARSANDPFPLQQRKQLFRNLGNGRFEDVTGRAGAVVPACRRSAAARRSAISTTTATSMSSSPTTAGRRRLLINNDRQPEPLGWIASPSATRCDGTCSARASASRRRPEEPCGGVHDRMAVMPRQTTHGFSWGLVRRAES